MGPWSHHIQSKGTDFLGGVAKIKKENILLYTKLKYVGFFSHRKKK